MTAVRADQAAVRLRRRLAERLEKAGALRSPQWRAAVETVPREVFLGHRVYERVENGGPTLWRPWEWEALTAAEWLALAYQDETLVTQLDRSDQEDAGGDGEPVPGEPTSSSTLPSLVVRMLEDLEVGDDTRVLEIGTGTGYSTALMCARLRSARVTSVEVDPGVAGRARQALTMTGYTPVLACGDGLAGHAVGAPYDRLIATCSVRHIPVPWLRQVTRGGIILAPVSGWLLGSGLARLRVTGPGRAEGRFLPGFVQFMPARDHAAPPLSVLPAMTDYTERPVVLGPELLSDWTGRFLAQLAAPGAQYFLPYLGEEQPMHLLCDQASGAWARLYQAPGGGWRVRQAGQAALWDDIERVHAAWRQAGCPPQSDFAIAITPHSQTVWLDLGDGGRLEWTLPGS